MNNKYCKICSNSRAAAADTLKYTYKTYAPTEKDSKLLKSGVCKNCVLSLRNLNFNKNTILELYNFLEQGEQL